jgi:hypothetical protein
MFRALFIREMPSVVALLWVQLCPAMIRATRAVARAGWSEPNDLLTAWSKKTRPGLTGP